MKIRFAAILFALATAGCAQNPYKEFYRSAPGMEAPRTVAGYDSNITALQVYTSKDFDADVRALARRGYIIIGESAFNAGEEVMTDKALRAQAQAVGAQVVLLSAKYTHTVNGVETLTVPTTTTSHTTGTATIYGSGGSATAYGSATTTTLGSETIMIPYTQRRFDADVLYFARFKARFGAQVTSLTDEMRKARGSNKGIMVIQIMDDTPAFAADILAGDIILSMNGRPMATIEEFVAFTRDPNNREVVIELVRDNKPMQKRVTLADLPPPSAAQEKASGLLGLF